MQKWRHPGGKLRELGADSLTDSELLAILISTGTRGKSAEEVAKEILDKFGSFKGMVNLQELQALSIYPLIRLNVLPIRSLLNELNKSSAKNSSDWHCRRETVGKG
jgi:DNA repair protein RadC